VVPSHRWSHPCHWHWCPPTPSQTLALNLSLITAWMLFLISVEADVSFSRKQLKRGLIWPRNTCPLSFCPSEMSWCPENWAVLQHRADIWLQVTFLDAAVDCVEWKWFPKVLICIDHGGMTVSHAVLSEYLSLIFPHWDFPRLPESFYDILLCSCWICWVKTIYFVF